MQHETDSPAIEARRLSKIYPGGVTAVNDISFEVAPGEVFGLLGPNGAGKSTTIGMLTTTIAPTSGAAYIAGFDVATSPLEARGASSVVFQDQVLDVSLTGRRNAEIHARLWGVDRAVASGRIDAVSAVFGVADILDRPVTTYSGGQRRRLEIARALISQPQVLILDEPTVGLDPRIRYELLDVIASLRAQSEMTILLTTHYLDEAERLCDRLAIMHLGEIVAMDTPQALLADLGSEVVEVRVRGDASRALGTLRAHQIANGSAFVVGATVTIPLHDGSASRVITAIRELDMSVAAIAARPPSLDDVYLRLTGASLRAAA